MVNLEKVAEEIVKGYLSSGAYGEGRVVLLEGEDKELRDLVFGLVTQYFVERGKSILVFHKKMNFYKYYCVDLDFLKKIC